MHPSSALATVLIDEWVRCGVREVVLCPGSRSAPLAYAALAAERAERLRLHVRVDERSAGFLAVGLAKVSRRPAVVITTSGTAVANLHPAVLEAAHACVPMVVMSADRPAELRGTGANQTTVQPGIFAGAVRFEHDQPPAQGFAGEQASWRSTVCRAWAAAVGRAGDPGPVHLNVALRDPLAPDLDDRTSWPEPLEGRAGGMPWLTWRDVTAAEAAPTGVDRPDSAATRHTRTLMVLGDLPDPAIARHALAVARRHCWPVIAEPFGARDGDAGTEVLPHGSLLLADEGFVTEHLPDRLLIVGRHTLHRELAALTRRAGLAGLAVEHVSATSRWSDPPHVVSRVHSWEQFLGTDECPSEQGWARAWHEAGQRLADRVARRRTTSAGVSGVAVAGSVLHALQDLVAPATLVLGSSNVPRDLNLADDGPSPGRVVVGNRGLAGIDGTISTAVGVALSAQAAGRPPVLALMGDLTFEHDVNALMIGPAEPRPDLTIVVVNDSGGGIFATLEYGDPARAHDFQRLFATPTGVDIGRLCAGFGVRHQRVRSMADLEMGLLAPGQGLFVVEVMVDPATDQTARREMRRVAADGDRPEAADRPEEAPE